MRLRTGEALGSGTFFSLTELKVETDEATGGPGAGEWSLNLGDTVLYVR